jgi:hypothetical protein
MEAVEILREVLTRFDLAPVHDDEDRLQPRGIINARTGLRLRSR